MAVYRNAIYVFGGYDGSKRLNDIHRFDLGAPLNVHQARVLTCNAEKQIWSQPKVTGETPQARSAHTLAVVNDSILLYGGVASGGKVQDSIWMFDCRTSMNAN